MDNRVIWEKNWLQLGKYSSESAGSRWAFYLISKICKQVTISSNTVIADVGCGIGAKTVLIAKLFPQNDVYGIDFSNQGILFATNFYRNIPNVHFLCSDCMALRNTVDGTIEMVSAFELIEHIEDWKSFLEEICSISQRYVLISTPTGVMREYERDLGHYRNFKKGQIEDYMKSQGYKPVKVFYAGFPFWSPITRDAYNIINKYKRRKKDETVKSVPLNPLLHNITYFFYRYLTFNTIGDQFVGLFEKENKRY